MLDPLRLWSAGGVLLAYGALCLWAWQRRRRARGSVALAQPDGWNVVYASQTGAAESLAHQAAQALAHTARDGSVRCLPLDQLDAATLVAGGRYLFVVSTHGQGAAPDNGAAFARKILGQALDLSALEFGLLALGDSHYPDFCAFGRSLAGWVAGQGGRQCFAPVEVDRLEPQALALWRQHLVTLLGADELPAAGLSEFRRWRLVGRQHLNPGSPGGEVHHLRFLPAEGGLLPQAWQSGDLALLCRPAEPEERPREYSIASLPSEGHLDLLVRRSMRADGTPGHLSGWLTRELPLGGELSLALQPHRPFRLQDNLNRPAIFIGNGVGLAGLRAHLAARIGQGNLANWLVFGERTATCDFHWREELERWQAAGELPYLDAVFSRDPVSPAYVQDHLQAHAGRVREWVAKGAAIYICGSRRGMGDGVDRLLRQILGEEGLAELALAGRYCRDVF